MKRVEISLDEVKGDGYHRFNLTPAFCAILEQRGLKLDRAGIPSHPWTTWFDRERGVQVFEQGER